jgi:Mrp family chromosome partitioning ATPase
LPAQAPPLELGLADLSFPASVVDPLRHLMTRLVQRGELPARLSVVAALLEEGVSYTTLALAATLAHDLGAKVCAVELNWWWPGRAGRGDPVSPGLAGVLAGSASLDQALLTTALPTLAVLPAGELPAEQRPVVARGTGVQSALAELATRFDYLLLDVPALLATSDAIPLAALGEACCLVLRQGVTPLQDIRRALDDVEHLRVLGVVLNQVRVATPRWLLRLVPQE